MKNTPIIWIFGMLLSLPFLAFIVLESFSLQFKETDFLILAPRLLILLLLCALLFFIGEAGLILSLKKTGSSLIEHIAATGALIRWYFLFLLILLGFFAFFFAPLSFAPDVARPLLGNISLIFFLFIASGAFILKMFGSFYLLLGRLSLGSAFRSSATLFMGHLLPSSLLFLTTIACSILASIFIDALHALLSFPLGGTMARSVILLLVILFLSSFLNVFFRAFWYFFFEAIAAEKPKDWQKGEKVIQESMVPVEDEA
jgi:hypothetical protein